VTGSAHGFGWLSILAFILAEILSLFALVSSISSLGFMKNFEFLLFGCYWGLICGGDKLFGLVLIPSRCSSWS
jgi:hypothetical protein